MSGASMWTKALSFVRPALAMAFAGIAVASVLPACASGDGPGWSVEHVGEETQPFSVGGCICPQTGSCSNMEFTDKPSNGTYYITTFGGGSDSGPMGCGGYADGTWAYIADSGRFGCGAHVKITANGKQCIAKVADCGPNKCVEEAASGSCGSHFPIIDASPYITKHLFGIASSGYGEHRKIQVELASKSDPIGCGPAQQQPSECQHDSDCSGGQVCDKGTLPYQCVKRLQLGDPCSDDKECNGGIRGTQRVCGHYSHKCIDACHGNFDCQDTEYCNKSTTPGVQWTCRQRPEPGSQPGESKDCVLTYPSGVSIQGVKTPTSVSNEYYSRGCGYMRPACMINVNDIKDAKTGKKLSYNHVKVSAHFTLRELTLTSAAVNPYVYVDPKEVEALEATRGSYGHPMIVNSGFRSPAKQNATCHAMCGKSYCAGACALCSDHMGGQATDLQHSSPKCAQAKPACHAGKFHLIYNEPYGGDHLHVDIGKGNGVCTYKAIWCG